MTLYYRRAEGSDLETLVAMLADDELGAKREQAALPLADGYRRAFAAIEADPNNDVIVAVEGEAVVGMLQLTFLPGLTYVGSWRAQIEGVRVAGDRRGLGIGRGLCEWAIAHARERGCRLVQLTTDKTRPEALRFYESLGFIASHEGLKQRLDPLN
ncbi:MAG: GNAT family N-acetyltransferase [Salinisphaera sp.]